MRAALEEVARALIHDSETDTPAHMHLADRYKLLVMILNCILCTVMCELSKSSL